MLTIKYDAMLIEIYIWRILESPLAAIDSQRNNSVILSCRMIDTTCIAFILYAKLALWISRILSLQCCCNCLWILLWLRQINGDIQSTVVRICGPAKISLHTCSTDIVGCTGQMIEVVGSILRRLLILLSESALNFRRSRAETVHNLRIKEVSIDNGILDQSTRNSFIKEVSQYIL